MDEGSGAVKILLAECLDRRQKMLTRFWLHGLMFRYLGHSRLDMWKSATSTAIEFFMFELP